MGPLIFVTGVLLHMSVDCRVASFSKLLKSSFPTIASKIQRGQGNVRLRSWMEEHSDIFTVEKRDGAYMVGLLSSMDASTRDSLSQSTAAYSQELKQVASMLEYETSDPFQELATKHAAYLRKLLDAEWQTEEELLEERFNEWPLSRLIDEGLVVSGVFAAVDGRAFGGFTVRFYFARREFLPPHDFSPGDEVIVSRESPLEEGALRAQILTVRSGRIICVMLEAPSTRGKWRLDRGPHKVSYDRSRNAVAKFGSTQFKAKSVRAVLLEGNDDVGSLNAIESLDLSGIDSLCLKKSSDGVPQRLNKSQIDAIRRTENHRVVLIQGPPGCGKTITACALLKAAYKGKPLLAVADSHAAVDQLARGLRSLNVRFVRIGTPASVSEELRDWCLGAHLDKHECQSELGEMKKTLRQLGDKIDHMRSEVALAKEDASDNLKRSEKLERAVAAQAQLKASVRKLELNMTKEIIGDAEVVCSTLISCGREELKPFDFDLVLMDEATQAIEPRALIAVGKLSRAGRLVLIGDQKQLPPTCVSPNAEAAGLGVSLFCRLLRKSALEPSMLKVQFRMHPLISRWPSATFYGGQIVDGVPAEERLPPEGLPWPEAGGVVFIPSLGGEKESPDGHSKLNWEESNIVQQVVPRILQNMEAKAEDIGVISPYRGQVAQLRRALNRWPGVEVKTVDGFQGREKDVIIFSCFRSNRKEEVGFLADVRRLNVALTRARRALIVVGNPNTLQHDFTWQSWLQFVYNNGLVRE